MKTFFYYILVLISIGIIASCQKEVDPSIPNLPQNDSTTLSRMVLLDTTLVPGQDSLFILQFTYDAQKRKSQELFTEIDNSVSIRYVTSHHYKYLGTDTLPISITEKYNFSTDSIIYYLSYSNGFIIKDSSVGYTGGIVTNVRVGQYLSLGSNRYLKKTIIYDPSSGNSIVMDSIVYTRTLMGGNLVSGLDSTWTERGMMILDHVSSKQLTFDNKINPLAPLTTWYLGYFDNFDDINNIDLGINNQLTHQHNFLFPFTSTDLEIFSYTYNTAGYPQVIRSNGTDGNKAFYFYTRL
jgi:hypothetical protein